VKTQLGAGEQYALAASDEGIRAGTRAFCSDAGLQSVLLNVAPNSHRFLNVATGTFEYYNSNGAVSGERLFNRVGYPFGELSGDNQRSAVRHYVPQRSPEHPDSLRQGDWDRGDLRDGAEENQRHRGYQDNDLTEFR
jgi:hypothetical protein